MKLIIPLAGPNPSRQYKPFSNYEGKPLISQIMNQHSLKPDDQLIFIILAEHEHSFNVSTTLKELFGNEIIIRILEKTTNGAPNSILEGTKDIINDDEHILIELADVMRDLNSFYRLIDEPHSEIGGIIPIQRDTVINIRPWGYVYEENGNVIELKEKQNETTSPLATMGLYYFSKGHEFIEAAEEMIKQKSFVYNNSFFVGPIYNELIKKGKKIITADVRIKHILI